jgi:Na+-translocating ferredoxin:NAD+ oxidoreductase RnfG subunit
MIMTETLLALLLTATTAVAQVHMTKEEALRTHFPGAVIERSTAFLTEAERLAIQRSARAMVESKVVTYYVARQAGRVIGTAFFETQTIRTMPATYMVVVDPDTSVRAVEMLAFYEPPDYHPSDRWLQQFNGRSADQDLYLKRGIHAISGATLTAQTVTDGVRRLLTTYTEVVAPRITP